MLKHYATTMYKRHKVSSMHSWLQNSPEVSGEPYALSQEKDPGTD
jgi:hypothetical protein